MAFVNNLWGATASFEDDQVTDVTPGDVNEQINDAVEVTENANAIDNGTEILSQAAEELENLAEVQDKNEEVIADAQVGQVDGVAAEPAEVEVKVEEQIQESQEALNDALLILGGKKLRNEFRSSVTPAFEAASTKLDLLIVSNEGIGDFFKNLWAKFVALLTKVGEFFKKIWNGFLNMFRSNKAEEVANKVEQNAEKIVENYELSVKDEKKLQQLAEAFAKLVPAGFKLKNYAQIESITLSASEVIKSANDSFKKLVGAIRKTVDLYDKKGAKAEDISESDLNTITRDIKEASASFVSGAKDLDSENFKSLYDKAKSSGKINSKYENINFTKGKLFGTTLVLIGQENGIDIAVAVKLDSGKGDDATIEDIKKGIMTAPTVQELKAVATAVKKAAAAVKQNPGFPSLAAEVKKLEPKFTKASEGKDGVKKKVATALVADITSANNLLQSVIVGGAKATADLTAIGAKIGQFAVSPNQEDKKTK